jgi:uncharacterized protein (TIGR02302 family)
MDEPNPDRNTIGTLAPAALGLHRALAALSLFWERFWPVAWPTVGLIGLFVALALLDAFAYLPGWLQALALVAFAATLAAGAWRAVRRIRLPSAREAVRRLETDSGLEHRPLTTVADRPAIGVVDPETEALWRLHIARAAAATRHLRLRLPRPGLAARDPYALRAALVILLVVGGFAAGPEAATRMARAFTPSLAGVTGTAPPGLELWITPPAYTNLPPRLLASADTDAVNAGPADGPITVPVGSVLLAQVSDSRRAPDLRIGEALRELEPVTERAWRAEATLETVGRQPVTIARGSTALGAWDIEVIDDRAPEIAFAEAPSATGGNALQLGYESTDDYGITAVTGRVTWPESAGPSRIAPVTLELPLPRPRPERGGGAGTFDLTAHPWAGLVVDIQLFAQDGRGQSGHTDRLSIFLPERTFNHPVAREIVAQRRVLALSPESREDVARSLHNIAIRPGLFDNDTVVFLALMSARSRLLHDRAEAAIDSLLPMLWDTALRLEDGALSLSQRQVAELQERLRQAIENGASDEEIAEIMDELRAALDRFLEALAQNLSQALEGMDLSSLPEAGENADLLDRDTMQQMLDQLEQMARLGDREATEALLEEMRRMLQALQNAPNMLQQQQNASPGRELLRELQSVVRRQQRLHDDTFQRDQRGESMSPGEAERARQAQNEVRRQLGELMRRLGEMSSEIPENLGNAEDAMGAAEDALEEGDLRRALDAQAQALDELQRGGQQMALQIMRQRGQGPGEQGGLVEPGEDGFDPLGRPLDDEGEYAGGFVDGGQQRLGEGEKALRALEIQNELRRRVQDGERPDLERSYIERLLRRF